MANEPSYLKVDTWVLRGEREKLATLDDDADWQAHVREVERALPVPTWVDELRDGTQPRRNRPWGWVVGLVAAAALVLFLAWPRTPYVGIRGDDLSVTLYVEQGVWEGERIPVGTPLRLELRGRRTPYYAVLLEEDATLSLVSAGPWPVDGVVPGAWAFDRPPGDDAALLVLALTVDPKGLSPETLRDQARTSVRRPMVPPTP
ncbi:MAG: hypothetical protein AAGA48_39960 [Myxococcota bacterium]